MFCLGVALASSVKLPKTPMLWHFLMVTCYFKCFLQKSTSCFFSTSSLKHQTLSNMQRDQTHRVIFGAVDPPAYVLIESIYSHCYFIMFALLFCMSYRYVRYSKTMSVYNYMLVLRLYGRSTILHSPTFHPQLQIKEYRCTCIPGAKADILYRMIHNTP